jgi:hypothetical protein
MTHNRTFLARLIAGCLLGAALGTAGGWLGVEIIRAVLAGVP